MLTKDDVLNAIKRVDYPKLNRDLVTLGFVKDVRVSDGEVEILLTLPLPNCDLKRSIVDRVKSEISNLEEVKAVRINALSGILEAPLVRSQGVRRVKNIIAVGSGKGGVGKSTVSVQLALALRKFGAKVGVLDADIYGASIPLMLGATEEPTVRDNVIEPVEVQGVKIISIGFFVPKDTAVIWRGPLVAKAVKDFLNSVDWGELDYLIVDLPPGTGDAPLTLAQTVSLTGVVIVSTPQKAALEVAIKAYHMFKKINIPILGFIENMSYLKCPSCGYKVDMFGSGNVKQVAKELGAPFLGELPIDPKLPSLEDRGLPAMDLSDIGEEFLKIAENLALEVSVVDIKSRSKREVSYTEIIRIGTERSEKAAEILRAVTGGAKVALHLKPLKLRREGKYEPVGEENLYSTLKRKEGFVNVVICDSEGNVKAISRPIDEKEVDKYLSELEKRGLKRYEGELHYPE